MKPALLFCCFFLPACLLHAQTEKIALLRAAALQAGNPKASLTQDLLLLEEHESLFKDSLMPLAQRSLALARQLGSPVEIGEATLGIINANLRQDNTRTADSLIQAALPQYPLNKASSATLQLKLRLANTGILAARSDYENAVKELIRIVEDAEQIQDYASLCRAFNELGVIAYNRNDLNQALEYYRRALSLADRHPQKEQIEAYSYINIAQVHAWLEHYDSAHFYLNLAKPLCEKIQNLYYLANAYAVEANVYKWSNHLPLAEKSMLRMVALRQQTEGRITFSNEQLGLANFYVYAQDYRKALALYKEGLAYAASHTAQGFPTNYEWVLRYYEGLAKCYQALGNRKQYEDALRQIIACKDSLNDRNAADAIAEMQTKYEVQKKETTIIAQKLDLTRKNFMLYGSFLLTVAGLLIGWLLFRGYRRKNRQRLETEKRHAAEAVKNAEENERKRIAADLHDNLGSYAASIKSNADEMKRTQGMPTPALDLLQTNAQQMVSLLSDTIWAMRKDHMRLSDISDRTKVVLQRLRPNYPGVHLQVKEALHTDNTLAPAHAYHLFMIVQEALNNALRHSGGHQISVSFLGGNPWEVCITDDGKGFPAQGQNEEGGNGLHHMQQRAASMDCHISWISTPAEGTTVRLRPTEN